MNQDIPTAAVHGGGRDDMKTVNIYESAKNTIWNEGKTFLIVFDENGDQIEDYDLATGLKIIQDDKKSTIFINDEDLVSGTWKFFGTRAREISPAVIEEKVESEGFKEKGEPVWPSVNEDPWTGRRVFGSFVSLSKRNERIDICRSCPFFIKTIGECSVDGKSVIESTKQKNSYCPVEKWGDKKDSIISMKPGGVQEAAWLREDQKDFDDDLEEYFKSKQEK